MIPLDTQTSSNNMAKLFSPYQQMRQVLNQWVDMPEARWNDIKAIFRVENYGKQDAVIFPGSRDHKLFFVCEGLLRVYTIADDGEEATKGFKTENIFAGPLAAFMLNLPSMYGVEALEKTTLLVARYKDMNDLYEQHPVFDRLGRRFMEEIVIQKELRERIALHQTAKERYQTFMRQFPELAQRVPLYHIASFLGITAESLSRVRNELARSVS